MKVKLVNRSSFKIKIETKDEGIVCSGRSQCRTTHKRKDC